MIPPISFTKPEVHVKAWGPPDRGETWIVNNDEYCAKLLEFRKDARFSMHYHWNKREHWYVFSGKLQLNYLDLSNATEKSRIIQKGEVVGVPAGNPHQLIALEDSIVFEVSTTHEDTDSYRIAKGDSQK